MIHINSLHASNYVANNSLLWNIVVSVLGVVIIVVVAIAAVVIAAVVVADVDAIIGVIDSKFSNKSVHLKCAWFLQCFHGLLQVAEKEDTRLSLS
jgi:hypothetical protein